MRTYRRKQHMRSFSDLLPNKTTITGKDYFKNNHSNSLEIILTEYSNNDLLRYLLNFSKNS